MSDDIWSQKTEYYDDGVKFGTGPEMITEIKSLSRKLEEARGRIAELEAALSRMINHFAVLPAEMDEPGCVMHQARRAMIKAEKEQGE